VREGMTQLLGALTNNLRVPTDRHTGVEADNG
jgi:hypothetical protein